MDRLLDQMNPSAALFPRGLSGINSEGNPCCESTQNQKNGAQNLKVVHRKKIICMNLERESWRTVFICESTGSARMITGLPSGGSSHICSQLTFCFCISADQQRSAVYQEALRLHFINISAGLEAKTESQQR